jgi:hypothetical protein
MRSLAAILASFTALASSVGPEAVVWRCAMADGYHAAPCCPQHAHEAEGPVIEGDPCCSPQHLDLGTSSAEAPRLAGAGGPVDAAPCLPLVVPAHALARAVDPVPLPPAAGPPIFIATRSLLV